MEMARSLETSHTKNVLEMPEMCTQLSGEGTCTGVNDQKSKGQLAQ